MSHRLNETLIGPLCILTVLLGVGLPPRAVGLDAGFSVSVNNPGAKIGRETTLVVTVQAKDGAQVAAKPRPKVDGLSGTNVKLPRNAGGQVSGATVTYRIPVTPTASGPNAVTGSANFTFCIEKECERKSVRFHATVTGS